MKALTNVELVSFCSQLALILKSGISCVEGLSLMLEGTKDTDGRRILETLIQDMESGNLLYEALSSTQAFPEYVCNMTEIGETSGRLDEVMEALAQHYRREDALSKNIRSSVTYPLVMLGMMTVVLIILIVKVMPVFQQVFDQLGTDMSGLSGAVLNIGNSLSRYGIAFIVLLICIAAAVFFLFFTRKGQKSSVGFSERFFATKSLSEKIACSRFASGMYLSLSSGLDIDQSLEMTERLVTHRTVRQRIGKIRALTTEGYTFPDAVSESGIFPGVYARMLSVGFRAGATDEVMKQISMQYDEDIENRMNSLIAKLEPTLVAVFSIIVGIILLSVMLPLMGIMSNIG